MKALTVQHAERENVAPTSGAGSGHASGRAGLAFDEVNKIPSRTRLTKSLQENGAGGEGAVSLQHMNMMMRPTLVAVACSLSLACSSDGHNSAQGSGGTAPTLGGAGAGAQFVDDPVEGGGASGGGAGGGAAGGASGSEPTCGPADTSASCVGETYAGENIPLDIYIMFDQSGSMCSCIESTAAQICPNPDCGQTRLDAIRQATDQFLNDPKSAGIGVGLGLFGKQPIGQASCAVGDYEAPTVSVGTLPEHASNIMSALNQVVPTGETPTGPALRGACSYARQYKQDAPQHQVVILLLTDGKPEAPATCQGGSGACCPSLDDAVTAAEQCRSEADVKTYVLGVGPLLENLEQIAVAGGTTHAYLVEGGDVSSQVLEALNRIRGDAAIPCQLQLPVPPAGRTLAYDEVNLQYQSSQCDSTLFYSVQTAAECGTEDGWYYDDPSSPASIHLCPTSCERVSGPGGSLFYSVGCATQIRLR
jgi:hypothetical protein